MEQYSLMTQTKVVSPLCDDSEFSREESDSSELADSYDSSVARSNASDPEYNQMITLPKKILPGPNDHSSSNSPLKISDNSDPVSLVQSILIKKFYGETKPPLPHNKTTMGNWHNSMEIACKRNSNGIVVGS